jgi:superfamily II DNA or RNA helicase
MPTPFSSEDLGRLFDAKTLTRGRSLVLIGAVEVKLTDDEITAVVEDRGIKRTTSIKPSLQGHRVLFERRCSCRSRDCPHLAATALAALDRYPALRRFDQKSLLDVLSVAPAGERRVLVFELSSGEPPHACFVTTQLIGVQSGKVELTTPAAVLAAPASGEAARAIATLLGSGEESRIGIPESAVAPLIGLLLKSHQGRWAASGKRLIAGEEKNLDADAPLMLPPRSAAISSALGNWYVNAATGHVGRVKRRAAALRGRPKPRRGSAITLATDSEQAILEQPVTPVLRLRRLQCPDDFGRLQLLDALTLAFDYGGVVTEGDDERQFVTVEGPAGRTFVRRDPVAEAAAYDTLQQDGFMQMRVADGSTARGRRVLLFRGRDAGEDWHRFISERLPALQSLGWRSLIERDFGPRMVQNVGACDVEVTDDEAGRFSLEFGIEIDGVRHALLPILSHLLERGGMDSAQIIGDDLITSLPDGRVLKLPADRIRRLLAIMGDLIEAAGRSASGPLVLPTAEAFTVLELEDLLATRWQNAGAIQAYVDRFRDVPDIEPSTLPASFTAELRPYQQHGVDWLQHLGAHGMGGFLADDMGLGKTAQTIAHITIELAAGRLVDPVLVVVPTSLVANWTAELQKFAPGLRVAVLHGLDRHQRRERLAGTHVVLTTYTVLTRDIEQMKQLPWHLVVLDEAQAIKSPDAKATKAVCQLESRQRLCLSGTPIENNLEELWSQFAFLMPGLLGDRRGFAKRFRTPIEKRGDDVRRMQLIRRIKPFIMRRTKSEVATELPPKHTILRRITLAPEQRELYETIRVTLYEKVREQLADHSQAQSRIIVLDALLKLRQACCDPRLVKLPSARLVETSSKLDDLMDMIGEMIPEGRRILLFSQFTSMLDLIKPRLDEAGVGYVELRGDTANRAEPVRRFEALEVPLFLISLKAGGRGLNLTSADTVIHYDPWWNPAVEDQASDRAHRIGQTKSVFVYKMIAADTVEERILELQQRKAELASIAFSERGELPGEQGGFNFDDIDYLFASDLKRNAA